MAHDGVTELADRQALGVRLVDLLDPRQHVG